MTDLSQFSPAEGYILVKPLEKKQEGISVISEDRQNVARVLSVGPPTVSAYTDSPIKAPCKVGQLVIHSSGGYETLKFGGEEFRLVHFTKVLMVLDKK